MDMNEEKIEYILIATITLGKKCSIEKLPTFSFELYYINTKMKIVESFATINLKFIGKLKFWYDWLSHLGSVILKKLLKIHSIIY